MPDACIQAGILAIGLIACRHNVACVSMLPFSSPGTYAKSMCYHRCTYAPQTRVRDAAAAAEVAYINSIANIASLVGNYIMGWLRDLTGSFDSGLLVIAAVCNVAAFATLCIHHDKELEQVPIIDDTPPVPGRVAEIV